MRFLQPFAGEGKPGQSPENVIQLGGQLAALNRVFPEARPTHQPGPDGRPDAGQTGARKVKAPPTKRERGGGGTQPGEDTPAKLNLGFIWSEQQLKILLNK